MPNPSRCSCTSPSRSGFACLGRCLGLLQLGQLLLQSFLVSLGAGAPCLELVSRRIGVRQLLGQRIRELEIDPSAALDRGGFDDFLAIRLAIEIDRLQRRLANPFRIIGMGQPGAVQPIGDDIEVAVDEFAEC